MRAPSALTEGQVPCTLETRWLVEVDIADSPEFVAPGSPDVVEVVVFN